MGNRNDRGGSIVGGDRRAVDLAGPAALGADGPRRALFDQLGRLVAGFIEGLGLSVEGRRSAGGAGDAGSADQGAVDAYGAWLNYWLALNATPTEAIRLARVATGRRAYFEGGPIQAHAISATRLSAANLMWSQAQANEMRIQKFVKDPRIPGETRASLDREVRSALRSSASTTANSADDLELVLDQVRGNTVWFAVRVRSTRDRLWGGWAAPEGGRSRRNPLLV